MDKLKNRSYRTEKYQVKGGDDGGKGNSGSSGKEARNE